MIMAKARVGAAFHRTGSWFQSGIAPPESGMTPSKPVRRKRIQEWLFLALVRAKTLIFNHFQRIQ
jgi:hypothetical protein